MRPFFPVSLHTCYNASLTNFKIPLNIFEHVALTCDGEFALRRLLFPNFYLLAHLDSGGLNESLSIGRMSVWKSKRITPKAVSHLIGFTASFHSKVISRAEFTLRVQIRFNVTTANPIWSCSYVFTFVILVFWMSSRYCPLQLSTTIHFGWDFSERLWTKLTIKSSLRLRLYYCSVIVKHIDVRLSCKSFASMKP